MSNSFFSTSKRDKASRYAAIGAYTGAAIGLLSAMYNGAHTENVLNITFGPICGLIFWGGVGWYGGAVFHKTKRLARFCIRHRLA